MSSTIRSLPVSTVLRDVPLRWFAGLSFARIGQMDLHLSAQHALGQGLLQLRGQGLEIQCPAGPSLCNQLIQQLA